MERLLHVQYNSNTSHSSLYNPKYTPPPLLSSFPTLAQLWHLVDIKDRALASWYEAF